MRISLTIFFAACCFANTSAQVSFKPCQPVFPWQYANILSAEPEYEVDSKSDLETEKLRGHVKTILQKIQLIDSDGRKGEVQPQFYEQFNKQGNCVLHLMPNFDSIVTKCNAAGLKVRSTHNYLKDHTSAGAYSYIRDQKGRCTSKIWMWSLYKFIYSYDHAGNEFAGEVIKKDAGLLSGWTVLYAWKNGLKASVTRIAITGTEIDTPLIIHYEYDPQGNMIESSYKMLSYASSPCVDRNGAAVKNRYSEKKSVFHYIQGDQLIESVDSASYFILYGTQKIKRSYDQFGNEDLTQNYDADGSKSDIYSRSYKYEYDKNDNWTKRMTITGGKITSIETRTIEYY